MNNCIDGVRQDAIGIALGNYIPRSHMQAVTSKGSAYTLTGAIKVALRVCTNVVSVVKVTRLIAAMLMLLMVDGSIKVVCSNTSIVYYGALLMLISSAMLLLTCTALLEIDSNSNKLVVKKSLHVYGIGGHPTFST
jgi:hypothetical protein